MYIHKTHIQVSIPAGSPSGDPCTAHGDCRAHAASNSSRNSRRMAGRCFSYLHEGASITLAGSAPAGLFRMAQAVRSSISPQELSMCCLTCTTCTCTCHADLHAHACTKSKPIYLGTCTYLLCHYGDVSCLEAVNFFDLVKVMAPSLSKLLIIILINAQAVVDGELPFDGFIVKPIVVTVLTYLRAITSYKLQV